MGVVERAAGTTRTRGNVGVDDHWLEDGVVGARNQIEHLAVPLYDLLRGEYPLMNVRLDLCLWHGKTPVAECRLLHL